MYRYTYIMLVCLPIHLPIHLPAFPQICLRAPGESAEQQNRTAHGTVQYSTVQ